MKNNDYISKNNHAIVCKSIFLMIDLHHNPIHTGLREKKLRIRQNTFNSWYYGNRVTWKFESSEGAKP